MISDDLTVNALAPLVEQTMHALKCEQGVEELADPELIARRIAEQPSIMDTRLYQDLPSLIADLSGVRAQADAQRARYAVDVAAVGGPNGPLVMVLLRFPMADGSLQSKLCGWWSNAQTDKQLQAQLNALMSNSSDGPYDLAAIK